MSGFFLIPHTTNDWDLAGVLFGQMNTFWILFLLSVTVHNDCKSWSGKWKCLLALLSVSSTVKSECLGIVIATDRTTNTDGLFINISTGWMWYWIVIFDTRSLSSILVFPKAVTLLCYVQWWEICDLLWGQRADCPRVAYLCIVTAFVWNGCSTILIAMTKLIQEYRTGRMIVTAKQTAAVSS